MPSVSTTFTTFGTSARAGSIGEGAGETWSSPSDAQTANGVRSAYDAGAAPTPWPDGYTHYLTAKQLTATVPTGATIDGVRATVRKRKSASGSGTWRDSAVHVIKGGSVQTAQNKATATAYTTSDASETYGGTTDKWGQTWTAAEVNGSGFGIAVSCGVTGMGFSDTDTAEIDAVTIEVFYTLPGTPGDMMLTSAGD